MLIGSLFAGIGGLEFGLERAGLGRVVWQVEQDERCRAVLARHWPEAERFDDVRTVGAGNLRRVDVICGGFPCQDISLAGKGAGLAGERSGLWFEFLRIVQEVRPRLVIAENVAALRTRGLAVVVAGLEAAGYRVAWDVLGAVDVGAPHRRKRIFIVAVADADREGQLQQGRAFGVERRWLGDSGAAVADADSERGCSRTTGREHAADAGQRSGRAARTESGPAEPRVGRSTHGVPAGLDRLARFARTIDARWPAGRGEAQYGWEPPRTAAKVPKRAARLKALGNAVVPQVAEAVGRWAAYLSEAA